MPTAYWRRMVNVGVWLVLTAGMTFAQTGDRPDFTDESRLRQYLTATAERIVLPSKCGECHKSEFQVWEGTRHATQFQDLHTTERAKKIYTALDLRLIRRATDERTPACLQCHYTPQITADGLRAQISVGCESCHGPARDWIGVHNNYGVKEADFQKAVKLETPEHRLQRIADAKAKGMRRPSEIYDVAANCFQCHTVPYEELVNRGGHSTGSDFELVSWSQKIRHNFLRSFLTGDGKSNAETTPERKRLMFVAGRALAVEYSLRGIAVATKEDNYLASMVDRSGYAVDALIELNDRTPIPEIAVILSAVKSVALKANNRAQLLAAADRIGNATKQFLARADPTQLTSLDALLNPTAATARSAVPPPATQKAAPTSQETPAATAPDKAASPARESAAPPSPTVPTAAAPPPPPATGAAPPGAVANAPPSATAPARTPAAASAPVTRAPPSPAVAAGGEPPRRPSWRSEPTHGLLLEPCANCHDPQVRWWRADPHSKAVAPFREVDAKHERVAAAYGISADEINQGNQICMWCHGTIIGPPTARVRAGVGCQQCHGPGQDYKEPHQKNRQQALALGLIDLKNASVRAETCAGCHYITEARLIAAGHPTGETFKFDAGVEKIKHWGKDFKGQAVDIAGPQLQTAYAEIVSKRGPVPRVARAAAPPPAASSPSPESAGVTRPGAGNLTSNAPADSGRSGLETTGRGGARLPITQGRPGPENAAGARAGGAQSAAAPPAPSVAPGNPPAVSGGVNQTPPAPAPSETPAADAPTSAGQGQPTLKIGPSDSVEEILLKLKTRLERLYELARKSGAS